MIHDRSRSTKEHNNSSQPMRSLDFDRIDDEINPDGILPLDTTFSGLPEEIVRIIKTDNVELFSLALAESCNDPSSWPSKPNHVLLCAWQSEALEIICSLPDSWKKSCRKYDCCDGDGITTNNATEYHCPSLHFWERLVQRDCPMFPPREFCQIVAMYGYRNDGHMLREMCRSLFLDQSKAEIRRMAHLIARDLIYNGYPIGMAFAMQELISLVEWDQSNKDTIRDAVMEGLHTVEFTSFACLELTSLTERVLAWHPFDQIDQLVSLSERFDLPWDLIATSSRGNDLQVWISDCADPDTKIIIVTSLIPPLAQISSFEIMGIHVWLKVDCLARDSPKPHSYLSKKGVFQVKRFVSLRDCRKYHIHTIPTSEDLYQISYQGIDHLVAIPFWLEEVLRLVKSPKKSARSAIEV